VGDSKFVRIIDKVDHDKLSADALFARRLYHCRLIKGGGIGVDGKDGVALGESFNAAQHNDLLLGQVKNLIYIIYGEKQVQRKQRAMSEYRTQLKCTRQTV
jgi:hypothetical protein